MAFSLTPYLAFNQQCEAAFRFYEKVLGAKLGEIHRFRGSPMQGDMPADKLDGVMHASLLLPGGGFIFGSDGGGPEGYQGIKGCQLSLGYGDVEEARRTFAALAEGGQVSMPFAPTFWAAGFGMLTDKFGVPWCVNVDTPVKT